MTEQGDHLVALSNVQYITIDGLILDGQGEVIDVVKFDNSNNLRVSNSELKSIGAAGFWNELGILINGGTGHEVLNNHIHDICNYGLYHSGQDSLIDENTFHDNGGYAIHVYSDGGGVHNNVVRNNILYRNRFNTHFNNGRSAQFPAMVISRGTNNIGYNNLIYNN
jgi:hypothetical protein